MSSETSVMFRPNALTFEQGIERIHAALAKTGGKSPAGRILTSRDEDMRRATKELEVRNVPEGFTKWQLPVFLSKASQLYVSEGAADTRVPEHSHDEGDGFRYILAGSIIYDGQELSEGDWMFIPQGRKYSFTVGRLGVKMCYCYCCSCA